MTRTRTLGITASVLALMATLLVATVDVVEGGTGDCGGLVVATLSRPVGDRTIIDDATGAVLVLKPLDG